MKKKTLCLLLLLPIVFVLIVFTSSRFINLPVDITAERLIIEHEEYEFFELDANGNGRYRLYGYAIPHQAVNSEIVWEVDDESLASIDGNYLVSKGKEGVVTVYARTSDGALKTRFTVELYINGGLEPRSIRISDPTINTSASINTERVYGMYNIEDGKLVASCETPRITVIPLSAPQQYELTVIEGNATLQNGVVTFHDAGKVTIKATSLTDASIFATYTYNVIDGGVNVYTYDDLMYCTNKSTEGEVVILRTNFESISNAYDERGYLYKNTQLFGREEKGKYQFDVVYIESTYDITYINNFNNNLQGSSAKLSTKVAVAVDIKKDLYGNGYTINLHELCYEEGDATSKIFAGPLDFVEILGMVSVSGQDNIGFLIHNDNVTVSNVSLRNTNSVNDLTELDMVGTTVEVMGDNVSITDCIISNGLTVLRSFSSENLTITNCLLQYGREFIFKIGSNTVVKPEPNQRIPADKYSFLSPELEKDGNGNPLSDSSATIDNCYFYRSGFFSIGLETHFAGEVLYTGSYSSFLFENIKNMAGTSYASNLTIKGDTRFYDWKNVDSFDASTLIRVSDAGEDRFNFEEMFNIKNIILKAAEGTEMIIKEEDNIYVHGGIAFYGGGRNESRVIFEDTEYEATFYKLEDVRLNKFGGNELINGGIIAAAGSGPFKFYTYKNTGNNYFNENPKIEDLRR